MKKLLIVLKFIVIAVCILLTCTFLFTMSCNIVNVGNIIGTIICLFVILLLLLYKKLKKIKPLRIFMNASAAVLVTGFVYSAIVSLFMISGMLNTPDKAVQSSTGGASEQQTVIVLGCKANNGHPSLMLKARLDKAVEYLRENPQAVCIVTGGQGGDEIEPEAVSMHRYLITQGIDDIRIYKEENSRNTEENLLYSAEIIEKYGLPKNVIVVSEFYHVYRGARNAEKQGLSATVLPAPSTYTLWAMPSYWVREIFAITRDYVFDLLT